MSRIEKLLSKFFKTPESLPYRDMEQVLIHLGFEKIHAKGSHVKFKHRNLISDIIIPVHNKECKKFYKKQVIQQIKNLNT